MNTLLGIINNAGPFVEYGSLVAFGVFVVRKLWAIDVKLGSLVDQCPKMKGKRCD